MKKFFSRLKVAISALLHGPEQAYLEYFENQEIAEESHPDFYEVFLVQENGRRLAVYATEIELFLGNDISGRPLRTTIGLKANCFGDRRFEIYSLPNDHKNPEDIISLTTEGLCLNLLTVTVKYEVDKRSDSEVLAALDGSVHQEPVDLVRALTREERDQLKHHRSHEWDGVTQEATLLNGWGKQRREWAHALQSYDWHRVLEHLSQGSNPNDWQLSMSAQNTPLHWAAEGGASVDVIEAMLGNGAWRNIRNAANERPVDVARRKGHIHLLALLQPQILHPISFTQLYFIEQHFHGLLRRASSIEKNNLRLPDIGPLIELEEPKMYFPVPGMCGGYSYWLDTADTEPKLVVENSCRIVSGPVPRYKITAAGVQRVESIRYA